MREVSTSELFEFESQLINLIPEKNAFVLSQPKLRRVILSSLKQVSDCIKDGTYSVELKYEEDVSLSENVFILEYVAKYLKDKNWTCEYNTNTKLITVGATYGYSYN